MFVEDDLRRGRLGLMMYPDVQHVLDRSLLFDFCSREWRCGDCLECVYLLQMSVTCRAYFCIGRPWKGLLERNWSHVPINRAHFTWLQSSRNTCSHLQNTISHMGSSGKDQFCGIQVIVRCLLHVQGGTRHMMGNVSYLLIVVFVGQDENSNGVGGVH